MRSVLSEATTRVLEALGRHERCCVLAKLSGGAAETMRDVIASIDEGDLHYDEDGGKGREDSPHVTVLYGITTPAMLPLVKEIAARHEPFVMKFERLSLFEGDGYEVLKVDVSCDGMVALHEDLRASVDNDWKWPNYSPHATVAYLKEGAGEKYVKKSEDKQAMRDMAVLVERVIFTDFEERPYVVELGSRTEHDLLAFLGQGVAA
jgi:hypothetical protein